MGERAGFPPGFSFGAATSAYQIEGAGFGGAGASIWDTFARRDGAISDGSNGTIACDHYHRFEADLDLLAGFDAYRFSTSWARILPEGRGTANPAGLDFYDRLVDAICARDLAPHLTLYHWDMPEALQQRGGWANPDVAAWFGDFAEIVIARIGDRLASVATLNEPWCSAWLGHFSGEHAPGLRDVRATARAMHNLLATHGEALARLRAMGQENLGIVLNFEAVRPAHDTPTECLAASRHDAIINRWFIEAIGHGRYPEPALEGLGAHLPQGWQDDIAQISAPLDWLGVNYYTRQTIRATPDAPWPAFAPVAPTNAPVTQMGWEIYPDGLFEVLLRLRFEQGCELPIWVTENGMARADQVENGQVDDPERIAFIDAHLAAMRRAIGAGVDLRGFFYWSLLDNFEWAHGYAKRFGLVHVDYASQKRTPKASWQHLRRIIGAKS